MESLLDYSLKEQLKKEAPLADRMRPQTLDEFIGQDHILAEGRLLRRAIQADQLSSLIFYGPPGTGKTTLAEIIANRTEAQFLALNAVLSGVKQIRESIEQAENYRKEQKKRTILFIDEVHRFNKAQQDALLPHVEKGTITLIGATTENPYFEVNKALVSRSRIFQLKPLEAKDLEKVVAQALKNKERGYGLKNIKVTEDAVEHLCNVANGDARALLNALELAVLTSEEVQGKITIDLGIAEESIQRRAVLYDKDGDAHFDTISAFIKSIRGSDPDAALYWLAKMVYAGEDPKYLFRRMIISAGEDIGLADPKALEQVMACSQAFDYVGMPEGRFHLAQACLYLATAKKSNSNFAFFDALNAVKEEKENEAPNHLKDASRDKDGLGHGEGYLYPHAYRDHWVNQQYLPDALQGRMFYEPGGLGYEEQIKEDVIQRREAQIAAMAEEGSSSLEESWQGRSLGNQNELLNQLREVLLAAVKIQPDQMALNCNAQSGLMLGGLLRKHLNLSLYAQVLEPREEELILGQYQKSGYWEKPEVRLAEKSSLLGPFITEGLHFDWIFGRNLFLGHSDRASQFAEFYNSLHSGGHLACLESVPGLGQRFSSLVEPLKIPEQLWKLVLEVEEEIYQEEGNPLLGWDEKTLGAEAKQAGFKVIAPKVLQLTSQVLMTRSRIGEWFRLDHPTKKTIGMRIFETGGEASYNSLKEIFTSAYSGKTTSWHSAWALLEAEKQVGRES